MGRFLQFMLDSMNKSVLIIAGHKMMAEFLVTFLQRKFTAFNVRRASTMRDARNVLKQKMVDLVLTDIVGHESSFLETIKEIKKISPKTRFLVLGAEANPFWVNQALRAGSDGFLTKASTSSEIVKAVNAVLQGQKYLSPDVKLRLAENMLYAQNGQLHGALSPREIEIFVQIGQGKSIKHISDELKLAASTVAVHKFNIAKKTGIKSSAKIALYCIEHGLLTGAA